MGFVFLAKGRHIGILFLIYTMLKFKDHDIFDAGVVHFIVRVVKECDGCVVPL